MKDSFVIYTKYEEQINLLSDTQIGVLFRALISYQKGTDMPKMDGITSMAFAFIRQQIDYDNAKYDEICKARSEAGKQGGRPQKSEETKGTKTKKANGFQEKTKKANVFFEKQTKAKKAESDNDNDTDICTPLYIPPQRVEKSEFQKKFFSVYCQFKKFADEEYSEIDFEKLLTEFGKSSCLRKTFSWKVILDSYPSIIRGDFRDKAVNEQAEGREYMADRERYYEAIRAEESARIEKIHSKLMQYERYAEIDKRLRALPCEQAKAELKGDKLKMAKLEQEMNRLRGERGAILTANGLDEDAIEPRVKCFKCKDTGFKEDGTLCECYKGA